jgi:hypothetical protein
MELKWLLMYHTHDATSWITMILLTYRVRILIRHLMGEDPRKSHTLSYPHTHTPHLFTIVISTTHVYYETTMLAD